jgi:peptidyl-prolyl cis-trans isomerase SurA
MRNPLPIRKRNWMMVQSPVAPSSPDAGCPILATFLSLSLGRETSSPSVPGAHLGALWARRSCFCRKGGRPHTQVLFQVFLLFLIATVSAQTHAQATPATSTVVLDHVVAVVNNQAILSSDIDAEIRLSVLDPGRGGLGVLTRTRALDQLIGRALIQQQMHQEDTQAAEPTQAELNSRLSYMRNEIPACVRQNCATDDGWKTFLAAHGLTQDGVETYLRYRVEILRFIEQRFRQGISILPQDIETYYRTTLVPQYAKGETVPPLDQVSSRIEEILLQQRVNALFDDWLSNLRKQGDIEVLDPALEAPAPETPSTQAPAQQPASNGSPTPGGDGKVSQ